jgi:outer membrane protein assembly factor BamA
MGYSFYHSNKKERDLLTSPFQENVYTVRAGVETAGNLLYGISNAIGSQKKDGAYEVFGIRYSQYAKVDFDYSLTHNFTPKSSVAFRVGFGAAVPYGNSNVLPFEKRFYAGGANSVRGWGVRTLGPGSYDGKNSVNSFIYQCGDVRLDLNLEYRAKLFWVIELGAFIDAGNIWTIKEYEDQPGGVFKFNEFYKQIAASYGLGLRLDFDYFLLRFDVGMKAHNPAQGQEKWPLIRPNLKRDAAFHFSVGYPF